MQKKNRLKKIEKRLGLNTEKIYVIDPFAAKGEEVVVSGGGDHYRISREEYDKLDTRGEKVIEVNFV